MARANWIWVLGGLVVAYYLFGGGIGRGAAGGYFDGGSRSGNIFGYSGFAGSNYDSGWRDALNTYDALQEKVDNFSRRMQWEEFENIKTWGPHRSDPCAGKSRHESCGYHR